MKLENVLKVMAAITALLVAASEVLNQANQYQISKNNNIVATDGQSSPAAE